MSKMLNEDASGNTPQLKAADLPRDIRNILEFWLRIMYEHTTFIEGEWPHTQTEEIRETLQFQTEYKRLLDRLNSFADPASLISPSERLTMAFRGFLAKSLSEHLLCKIKSGTSDLLFDHLKREAGEFLFVLRMIREQRQVSPVDAALHENTFWLKIMSEHSYFIAHYLDPSNRLVLMQVHDFMTRFDNLYRQAIDLDSFLENLRSQVIPVLETFNNTAISETSQFRDFKLQLQALREKCATATTAPLDLLEHIAREAEHYINNLKALRIT